MRRIRTNIFCFLCLLMAVVISPKTIDHNLQSSTTKATGGGEGGGLLSLAAELLQSSVGSPGWDHQSPGSLTSVGPHNMLSLLRHHLTNTHHHFKNTLITTLGVSDDFLKPLIKILDQMKYLQTQQSSNLMSSKYFKTEKVKSSGEVVDEKLNSSTIEGSSDLLQESQESSTNRPTINDKFIQFIKTVFEEEFSGLDIFPGEDTEVSLASSNFTSSNLWVLVKSTWERLLAYIEEENSLETFMQHTPVRIIDRVMSLGDDLNLINFLAKKLDPDFAKFLVSKTEHYLGPLRDFDTFYNFTRDYGMNDAVDYFTSDKFTSTMDMLSRLVSAYLEDRISVDLVNQYIDLISFGNIELHNFYKSIMKLKDQNSNTIQESNTTKRFRRDVLEHIASTFRLGESNPVDISQDQFQSRTHKQMDLHAMESSYYNLGQKLKTGRDIIHRDGGYGGGGYSGGYGSYGGGGGYGMMSGLDPYVALGALALGTLLGFLLFRLLNGTANGRRDIGDGSLLLWDSDLPDKILPWGSSVERMKRQVHDDTQGFSLPPSLRGDVWSSDPLVADNSLDDHLNEDDIAHHLNHLWHLYRDNNETACIHSHLCDVMANSTAHHLTGKDSSLALLMASVSNLMGVVRSGQLVDHVTQTLVMGHPYSCPVFHPYCSHTM